MEVFLEKLKQFILSLTRFIEKQKPIQPPIEYVPQEEIKEESKEEFPKPLGWKGTKKEVENEVRRVCQEENLSDNLTQELLATIQVESAFDINAVFKNIDGKLDAGIAQLSERFYLKYNNMTVQEACDDPERCVKIMIKAFKKGRARDWVANLQGKHLRYLKNGRFISPN